MEHPLEIGQGQVLPQRQQMSLRCHCYVVNLHCSPLMLFAAGHRLPFYLYG